MPEGKLGTDARLKVHLAQKILVGWLPQIQYAL